MNNSIRSVGSALTRVRVLSLAAASVFIFLTVVAPARAEVLGQTTRVASYLDNGAQGGAAAFVDQNSLLQTTKEFRITGTATGATSLQVFLLPGDYTGAVDWKSVNAAIAGNAPYSQNSTAKVVKGKWVAAFVKSGNGAGVPMGTYTLLIFNLSDYKPAVTPNVLPTVLTKAVLVVTDSVVATAAVDQSALSQTTEEFIVTGTATGATSLQVFLLPGDYAGGVDWKSVNAAIAGNAPHNQNASAQVVKGAWKAPFGGANNSRGVRSGTYTVLVFDLSKFHASKQSVLPTMLTRATLVVKNTIPVLRPYCNIAPSELTRKFGQPVTITWLSKNATAATIEGEGSVALKGSMVQTVEYTGQSVPFTKKWVMTVTGAGGSINCSAVVRYTLPKTSSADAEGGATNNMLLAAVAVPFSVAVDVLSDMFLNLGIY